jgi:hypothetical protein
VINCSKPVVSAMRGVAVAGYAKLRQSGTSRGEPLRGERTPKPAWELYWEVGRRPPASAADRMLPSPCIRSA